MRRTLLLCLGILVLAAPAVADAPITLDLVAYQKQVVIEQKRITCTASEQTGITIRFPSSQPVAEVSVTLRDITITPGCTHGIRLINAWSAVLDGINIYGGYGDWTLQNGVIIEGQSHDVRIRNATIFHPITCFYLTDVGEGTTIGDSTCLGAIYGVYALSSGVGRPWLLVRDSHFATSRAGIVTVNRKQVIVHSTLFYPHVRGYTPRAVWEALVFINTSEVIVRDVIIDCKPDAGNPTYHPDGHAITTTIPLARKELLERNCR